MELTATTTVRRPVAEVYAFWRLLENLPTFMEHLDEVRTTDEKTSTWTASAPFDRTVVWEALVIEDVVEERIAWRSTEQALTGLQDLLQPAQIVVELLMWLLPEVLRDRLAQLPRPDVVDQVHVHLGPRPGRRGEERDRALVRDSRALGRGTLGQAGAQGVPAAPGPAVDGRGAAGGAGRMRANCWASRNEVEVREVPDPAILNSRDAIVRITSTAICGSDLHLLDGYVPTMQDGDVMGHEFMGEVVEVGPGVDPTRLRIGDRVVVPFPIACGACGACAAQLYSCCENSNPNAGIAETMFGHPVAGIFGYSHLTGGFAGGQAQYARVPFADVGPLKIESDLADEQVLVLSDILPTGYMGAEMCDIQPSDVVAVWGAGPVGQFAMDSARVLGAASVIAIDKEPYRLRMAEEAGHVPVNFEEVDVRSRLLELSGGRGPDKCIDAVGMEAAHGSAHIHAFDRVKQAVRSETDRPHALRQAIMSCRSGGIVSVIGVYGGMVDKFPAGAWMNRSLTLRTGQCHVQRYMAPLLRRIELGELDPTRVITHRLPLEEAPHGYDIFKNKQEDCEKVVLTP